MSAPTIKASLALVIIKPLMPVLALMAATASPNSLMVAVLRILTASPCRSKISSTFPSPLASVRACT